MSDHKPTSKLPARVSSKAGAHHRLTRMVGSAADERPLMKLKRTACFNHVCAAASRFGWRPLFDIVKTSMDPELMALDAEAANRTLQTECNRQVAVPFRNGCVLVWPPTARRGDIPVAGCISISAAGAVPDTKCKLAVALRPLQTLLSNEYKRGRFLELRVSWVRAMLRMEPAMRDDRIRGGWRTQFGFAQGVTRGKLDSFVGQAIAPKELGGLVYPSESCPPPLPPLLLPPPPSLCGTHGTPIGCTYKGNNP